MNHVVCIPAYKPDKKLLALLAEFQNDADFLPVVVDDGSGAEYAEIFSALPEGVALLRHEFNRGKGAGLKTAFRYLSEHCPDCVGAVTIDGDGQHLLGDIIACGERMLKEEDKVVIGCRDFSLPDVPPRSVTGNRFTSAMFRLCFGIRITDTQTGLRAIPAQFLARFTEIEGERFEYETNMLLQMKRLGIAFVEQPIETVYDKEEYSSHYNALKDSWRIFKVMARFMVHRG